MINRVVCAHTNWGSPVFHLYANDELVGRARTANGIAWHMEKNGGPAPVIRGHIADTHAKTWKDACELL